MKDKNWFYFYNIEFFDQLEEKITFEQGFVRAESFADALAQISKWYGEEFIESIHLRTIEDGDGPLTTRMIKSEMAAFYDE